VLDDPASTASQKAEANADIAVITSMFDEITHKQPLE
jgi:hypothetical protein